MKTRTKLLRTLLLMLLVVAVAIPIPARAADTAIDAEPTTAETVAEETAEENEEIPEVQEELPAEGAEEFPVASEPPSEEEKNEAPEQKETEAANEETAAEETEAASEDAEKPVRRIVLTDVPEQLTVGEVYQLSVHTEPEDLAVVWSSSDSEILSVDGNGTVTAKAIGEAKITVAAKDDSEISAETVLQVVAEEKPALNFEEVLKAQADSHKVVVTDDVVVTNSVQVPADVELYVEDGSLTVLDEGKLSIAGYCEVTGGEVIVSDGAELVNQGFAVIGNAGKLIVEDGGVYTHEDGAVVILDQSEGMDASVEGINRGYIELTLAAKTTGELSSAIHESGYAFVTVVVPSGELLSAAGIESIPDAVCILLMKG